MLSGTSPSEIYMHFFMLGTLPVSINSLAIFEKFLSTNKMELSLSFNQNSISGGANLVFIGTKIPPAQGAAYRISKYLSLFNESIAALSSVLKSSFFKNSI